MKYIFDFDRVLFNVTGHFTEHIYSTLKTAGITRNLVEEYLDKERWNQFSLKKMLAYFSLSKKLYEEIMDKSPDFLNKELLTMIEKAGRKNCYIVSYGDEDFQRAKIKSVGIISLFSEVIIVGDTKKGAVEGICAQHKNEEVIFIDDREKHFKDLDFQKYPNLKTILYTGQNLDSYLQ